MMHAPPDECGEVLFPADAIARRVAALGDEISKAYSPRPLHLIGILKGAWVFMADLVRHLDLETSADFLGIASYGGDTQPSGEVRLTKDLDASIEGRDVLVVEDILDTGRTAQYLREILRARKPATLKFVTLLDKRSRRAVPIEADFVGFEIPDVFVVGYGLDYAQKYRELPDIHVLRA